MNFIKHHSTKKHINWISETILSYVPIIKFTKILPLIYLFKKRSFANIYLTSIILQLVESENNHLYIMVLLVKNPARFSKNFNVNL